MKLIERLYIAFYKYSEYNRDHSFKAYIHPRFDSIFYLSLLTTLNLSSFLLILKIKPLFTTHLFDCFFFFIIIVVFLLYHFEYKSRYKGILLKYDSPKELGKIEIVGWGYAIITLIFFFVSHNQLFSL